MAIDLDPTKTAGLEPSEGDELNGSWISSFDVPRSLSITLAGRGVRTIRFSYLGGEEGGDRRLLDDHDPPIQVLPDAYTGKVLELNFASPVYFSSLPEVGARIAKVADKSDRLATRYNFQMISRILCNHGALFPVDEDVRTSPPRVVPPPVKPRPRPDR